jgi:hypothetical protein
MQGQQTSPQGNGSIDATVVAAVLTGIPLLIARLLPPLWVPVSVIVAVGIVTRMSTVSVPATRILARLNKFLSSRRSVAALSIWILACGYFCFTAFYQHRDLFPRIHDEHCYLIQARMLAAGHLWEPQHPAADFFDNFYMLSRPVYAPIYFPGTALADAPFVRLGAPYWLMPVLAAGLVVSLIFSIVSTLIDEVGGLVAAFCAFSSWGLREYSTLVMAQVPLTALVLLAFWSWLNWRRSNHLRWMALAGAAMGWAAITRPVDALAFAIPVGLATLWHCRREQCLKRLPLIAVVTCLPAAPFLALQAIQNLGTTGGILKSPYTAYLKADQPGSEYGFHGSDDHRQPRSPLVQKRDYIDRFRATEIRNHTIPQIPHELARRIFWTGVCTLPAGILALLLPPAFFGLNRLDRLTFFSAAPIFILLYVPNPFFLVHYTVPLVPVTAFLIALSIRQLSRGNTGTRAFFSLIVLAVCFSVIPEFRPDIRDGRVPPMPLTALLHDHLDEAAGPGSVVLICYQTGDNPVEDPVYNDDVVYPDIAPVIRAHDLGSRNMEIAYYYAIHQPWRRFYLLDRKENAGRATPLLHPLGTAAEYAKALRPAK